MQQEVNDSLFGNVADLVVAVTRQALADALAGELSAQRWLDVVAPVWRERWRPPAATWEIDQEGNPVGVERSRKLCKCGQRLEGRQRFCDACQVRARRRRLDRRNEAERRKRMERRVGVQSPQNAEFVQRDLISLG